MQWYVYTTMSNTNVVYVYTTMSNTNVLVLGGILVFLAR